MRRRDSYQAALRALNRPEWPRFLREHSGLPGPRANLELAQAVADVGDGDVFDTLIATDEEYLVLCGVLGLGRLLADDVSTDLAARLRANAPDSRWRVREGVAMALQRVGDSDVAQWRELANSWACDPDPLVQRAAVAGVCEPRLLQSAEASALAVALCQQVTYSLAVRPASERRADGVARCARRWATAGVSRSRPTLLAAFQASGRSNDTTTLMSGGSSGRTRRSRASRDCCDRGATKPVTRSPRRDEDERGIREVTWPAPT